MDDNLEMTVTKAFVETFSDPMLSTELASALSCSEVNTLAVLFDVFGARESANLWMEQHSRDDDEGDVRHDLAAAYAEVLGI